jgi:hypothetical protein
LISSLRANARRASVTEARLTPEAGGDIFAAGDEFFLDDMINRLDIVFEAGTELKWFAGIFHRFMAGYVRNDNTVHETGCQVEPIWN